MVVMVLVRWGGAGCEGGHGDAAESPEGDGELPRARAWLAAAGEDFRAQRNLESAGDFEQIDIAIVQLCVGS